MSQTQITLQLEHDRDMRALERLHGLISSGAKGLSILGSGAAVTTLAFVQALIGKSVCLNFKYFAVIALACFLIAAFLPAIAFFFHYAFLNKPYSKDREKQLKIVWVLLKLSSCFLFSGGIIIFTGVLFRFNF